MEKENQPQEFDSVTEEAFQDGLNKALEEEQTDDVKINIDKEEPDSIIKITDESNESEKTVDTFDAFDELPVIDTGDIFDEEIQQEQEVDDEVLERISNQLSYQVGDGYPSEESSKKKKKLPFWVIPTFSALACIVLIVFLLVGTKAGRNFLLAHGIGEAFGENTNYEPVSTRTPDDPAVTEPAPTNTVIAEGPTTAPGGADGNVTTTPEPDSEITPEVTPEITPELPEQEQEQYHFLVLGLDEEEEIKSADLIMMISVNVTQNKIHLTTILRDLFVNMQTLGDDKISMAYSKGGVALLYDIFEKELGVRPDGYLLFDYEGFRTFMDELGGVDIDLTAKEADYLNKTNYISQPENRTMTAGVNHMNGDQALGYCRIRHVGTAQNEYNDIGRTARCRRMIQAVYEQNKQRGAAELYKTLKQCFSMITTDITGDECTAYLEKFLNMKEIQFDAYRIPAEGSYTNNIIRGKLTLVADMAQNRRFWQEFLLPQQESLPQ